MEETARAFELPRGQVAPREVPDRLSVRDYVRSVEIGAFRSEHGVTQRVLFNVVIEVAPHGAAAGDDVDRVLSYDTIVDAIEAELAAGRFNLLETLAEGVAARCLADPRVARAHVRIEKLDRIPGALGVEIVRSRSAGADAPGASEAIAGARVIYLAPPVAAGPKAAAWRDAVAALDRPAVVCLAPAAAVAAEGAEARRRIGYLAIDQAAWAFADADARFEVVGTRTELGFALRTGRRPVWAPSHLTAAALDAPDAGDPGALAAWLAAGIGAELMIVAGARRPVAALPVVAVAEPGDLEKLQGEETL